MRRKEYFVLVTMNPEAIGKSEFNTMIGKSFRSDNTARVLSTGGRGGSFPPNVSASSLKVSLKKNYSYFK